MKLPDRKILICVAALALALTVALIWTSSGKELSAAIVPSVSMQAAPSVSMQAAPGAQSAALGSPEEAEEPLSPLPELADGGAFEKLKEALEDAFERLSAENVYRLISNKKVDLSWEKAIAVFTAR